MFGHHNVEKSCVVGLNGEEEQLLEGNQEELRPGNDMRRIRPDVISDKVRVPWCRGEDSNLRSLD